MPTSSTSWRRTCPLSSSMITTWLTTRVTWSGRQTNRPTGHTPTQSSSCRERFRKISRETTSTLRSWERELPCQSVISDQIRTLRVRFSPSSWLARRRQRTCSHHQATLRCASLDLIKYNLCHRKRMLGQLSSLLRISEMRDFSQMMVSSRFKKKNRMEVRQQTNAGPRIIKWSQQMKISQARVRTEVMLI